MLAGQLMGATAVAIIAVAIVAGFGTWSFDVGDLRPSLRLGLPLLPHALSAWTLRLADRWLIVALIGLPAGQATAQLGVYALGYQLGYVVSIVLTSFNSAWAPYFYRVGSGREGRASIQR